MARSHVFNLRAREKDHSGVALVAASTRTSLIHLMTFPKRFCSVALSLMIFSAMSSKLATFSFLK